MSDIRQAYRVRIAVLPRLALQPLKCEPFVFQHPHRAGTGAEGENTVPPIGSTLHHQVEGLYAAHHGWLRGWLRKRLGDAHQAADLAHDAFVRVLAHDDALSIREPRAFLATIAQRLLINHWRRQQIEAALLAALAERPETWVPSEEARAIVVETLLEIDALLDGLPRPVKRVFLLSQLDGLRHAEIAAEMGISMATVKRYLTRAAQQCYFGGTAVADR